MRSFLLYIICALALFSSCDWVNDDLSDCPSGTWIKIAYTYNILNVDAASTQVGDISILAFDQNDKYVGRIDVDSITLHQNACMVKVPFSEGTYNFVIWGGASGRTYNSPTLTVGETERKDLSLALICDNENRQRGKLNGLFYSSLEDIPVDNGYQVHTAFLMKDTNYFACMLQDETNASINPEDFAFVLEATNGVMNYANLPMGTQPVYYDPYEQTNTIMSNQVPAIQAKISTLRLMKDDHTMLSIIHVPTGISILKIPITQYLLLTKIYSYNIGEMDDQEYLDRQDSYALLFFIKSTGGIPQICPKISVGGWIVRLDMGELESL